MDAFSLNKIYNSLLLRYSVFNLLVSQFALLHLSKKADRAFLSRGLCTEKPFLVYFSRGLSFALVTTIS